jgi:hypothetical protein
MDKRLQHDEPIRLNQALAVHIPFWRLLKLLFAVGADRVFRQCDVGKAEKDHCLAQKDVTASWFQIVLRLQRQQD